VLNLRKEDKGTGVAADPDKSAITISVNAHFQVGWEISKKP